MKKPVKKSKAAVELAQRSVEARKKKWGEKEFKKKMRQWGRLGGRPRKGAK
ncbi:MAG: hypothetical protein HY646_06460 [Acidobacteria bacterium]|nr:hypothetical protein [Acidobacteriota bacterium]